MSSARVELAGELAQLGRVEEARSAYLEALETLPEHPDALYGLARLARDYGGDVEEAEALATRLLERRPESPEVAVLVADLRARLGQFARARAVLEEALERSPDSAELRQRLSTLR
jgi:tetratricopeptide (TPR) repeat protein